MPCYKHLKLQLQPNFDENDKMQLFAKFKKILRRRFRATLNFQNLGFFFLNDDLGTKSGGNSSSSDSDSDDGKYLIHHHQRIAVIWST